MAYTSRHRRFVRFLTCEEFEARFCLTSIAFVAHDINESEVKEASSVHAADLDGDGDMDVLSASLRDDKIAWYENTDGKGSFGPQKVITVAADGALSVYAADVDSDGDVDVLSTSSYDGKIAWYENTDGEGTFGEQKLIATVPATGVLRGSTLFAADIDGDGDVDVFSAPWHNNKISWYENTDGKGTFGEQQVITTTVALATAVYAADIDADGDVDALSASLHDHKIAWYENTDGEGTFGPQQVITTAAHWATSVFAADVDGDGDVDVLSASASLDKLAWYENTDGKGTFGEEQVIMKRAAWFVHAVDVDGDGDMDVLTEFSWYENTDGKGSFRPRRLATERSAVEVYAADVDGDGDVDVLSAGGGKIAWYENIPLEAGDANRDFQFDQLDIVQVLQAAKYLSGGPATFEEGDWTGDGVFNQLDVVAALQTGNYLRGPYAARAVDAV